MWKSGRYFDKIVLGGVAIDICGERQLVSLVESCNTDVPKGAARLMFDANGQGLAIAAQDPTYAAALRKADVIHADGQPLVIASRLLCEIGIYERTATTDLIHAIGRSSEKTGISIYFLGAKQNVIERAAAKFLAIYPNANLVGFRNGYFDVDEIEDVVKDINLLSPDVVFVGMGKPVEQIFCVEIKDRINARWLITAGGCFDFLAGDAPRAPQLLQTTGFEWLFRLVHAPRRLGRRYLTTNFIALWLLITRSKRRRLPKSD